MPVCLRGFHRLGWWSLDRWEAGHQKALITKLAHCLLSAISLG